LQLTDEAIDTLGQNYNYFYKLLFFKIRTGNRTSKIVGLHPIPYVIGQ